MRGSGDESGSGLPPDDSVATIVTEERGNMTTTITIPRYTRHTRVPSLKTTKRCGTVPCPGSRFPACLPVHTIPASLPPL